LSKVAVCVEKDWMRCSAYLSKVAVCVEKDWMRCSDIRDVNELGLPRVQVRFDNDMEL